MSDRISEYKCAYSNVPMDSPAKPSYSSSRCQWRIIDIIFNTFLENEIHPLGFEFSDAMERIALIFIYSVMNVGNKKLDFCEAWCMGKCANCPFSKPQTEISETVDTALYFYCESKFHPNKENDAGQLWSGVGN